MTVDVVHGDCRAVMASMEANSVDAVVCDPPYDLLSVSRNGSGRTNGGPGPYGRTMAGGFMGMAWDGTGVAFDPSTWVEVMRVLKPGGHLLAFGGPRTFHRLTCAIEDAGFEIRDVLSWLYGSGFPKSLDVSKAIDKAAGAEREVIGWNAAARISKGSDERNAAQGKRSMVYNDEPGCTLTAPATPDAERWSGWGTALKPAWEPILLARKPLGAGTVAANVLKWGTGGINVDGCRIGSAAGDYEHPGNELAQRDDETLWRFQKRQVPPHTAGRWPTNLALDEDAAAALDEQSGERASGQLDRSHITASNQIYGVAPRERSGVYEPSTGGASRFFYTAKASRAERNERVRQAGGTNGHPTVKPVDLMRWLCRLVTPPGGRILDPFVGSGTTLVAALLEGFEATGIDQSAEYVELARKRIDGIQMGGLVA